jgi:hypothetical protein
VIWKHRSRSVFDGSAPNVQVAFLNARNECESSRPFSDVLIINDNHLWTINFWKNKNAGWTTEKSMFWRLKALIVDQVKAKV